MLEEKTETAARLSEKSFMCEGDSHKYEKTVENSITKWEFADERPEDAEVRKRFMEIAGGGGVADPAAIDYENHTRNFKAFLDSLEKGQDFWIDGPEARKAVEVILAIYESAREGKPVKLG